MAAKGSFCEMCGQRGKRADMHMHDDKYFCSQECIVWFKDTYEEGDEPVAEGVERSK